MEYFEKLIDKKKEFLVPCVYHFFQRPPVLVRGEGAYLFDSDGKKYLDCFSGVTVVSAGHSNPEIIEAAITQLRKLQHTTTIYLTEPMLELAETISSLTPGNLKRSFFCASGSEANEGALMLSSLATGRHEIAYLKEGLHGRTKWAINVTGLEMWRTDPNPMVTAHAIPGTRHPESLEILEELLKKRSIAAVIAEPIQGNGGIIVPPNNYWPRLRKLCSQYGTLLIADEIQTAWNRTGRWFATQHWDVTPDIITVAKALGNGFPIAAYITSDEIAAHYTRPGAATFGGNLVSCAAALATLIFHKRHNLGDRSERLGNYLQGRLQEIQARCPTITEVRGLGLMIGVELKDSTKGPAPALVDQILESLKDSGFLIGKSGVGRNVITFLPPLIIEKTEIDALLVALEKALEIRT
ncbi:aspartate aminotransferase family protein [Telmatocola sphagniphila]|uniref:alanine--glyoxylate transaminase n=1 Tax=Telmatocola sphagniphila TaxID=1123043 RepID=A0A8E6EW08_9BACT|nr:aspartate aminotransferase family protein [Telmatocola sphagniphila]QVL33475.1 aspartate aminotransferase family protein [Telmatocola sphagniphila]